MRRTRWTAGAALLLIALASTQPAPSRPTAHDERTLDFTGIERVHFETDGDVDIEIGSGAPKLSVRRADDIVLTVERRGDTLHLATARSGDGYYDGTLIVPPRLRHLELVGDVDIAAKRPIPDLRITTDSELSWQGDARRLEIVRTSATRPGRTADADDSDYDPCECGGVVSVDGRIDDLHVAADTGAVWIDRARGHGHATLDLADGVTFDLERAVDLEGVTLRRRPAAASTPAAAPTPAEAAR